MKDISFENKIEDETEDVDLKKLSDKELIELYQKSVSTDFFLAGCCAGELADVRGYDIVENGEETKFTKPKKNKAA